MFDVGNINNVITLDFNWLKLQLVSMIIILLTIKNKPYINVSLDNFI